MPSRLRCAVARVSWCCSTLTASARGGLPPISRWRYLSPAIRLIEGDYQDLTGADLVMITAGVNERAGGATDRSDPSGRLRLLDANAAVYRDILPRLFKAAPEAMIRR